MVCGLGQEVLYLQGGRQTKPSGPKDRFITKHFKKPNPWLYLVLLPTWLVQVSVSILVKGGRKKEKKRKENNTPLSQSVREKKQKFKKNKNKR